MPVGTTNFQQFNPPGNNMETDSAYTADTTRSGGAVVGQVFASILANKLFYQLTTFVTALADMLANKGFSTSDANLTTLTSTLACLLTTADLGFLTNIVNVAYSATPTFDASQGVMFNFPLNGNVTSSSLVNTKPGQQIVFMIRQNGTGGNSFVWPTNVHGGADPSLTANQSTTQEFQVWSDGSIRAAGPPMVT